MKLKLSAKLREAVYQELLRSQGRGCAICGRPPRTRRLHLDHDHRTGVIRGLLCHRCNRLLVGSNTLETAQHVVSYLKFHADYPRTFELDSDGQTVYVPL